MSADNWTICPRCESISTICGNDDTLREDFGVGIRAGEFHAHYKASCMRCGFLFEFDHIERVVLDALIRP